MSEHTVADPMATEHIDVQCECRVGHLQCLTPCSLQVYRYAKYLLIQWIDSGVPIRVDVLIYVALSSENET